MSKPIVAGRPRTDLAGKRFGLLEALEYIGGSRWRCRCDCGRESVILTDNLNNGHTKSCGCMRMEGARSATTTHHGSRTREYKIWAGMKKRCCNPAEPRYADYGARGIAVCERWMNDFPAFIEDMGPAPSTRHSLDRYPDRNGPYSKENCRWATAKQQARNMRNNIFLTYQGVTKLLVEWAEEYGLIYLTLFKRIKRGWPMHEALSPPDPHRKRPKRPIT